MNCSRSMTETASETQRLVAIACIKHPVVRSCTVAGKTFLKATSWALPGTSTSSNTFSNTLQSYSPPFSQNAVLRTARIPKAPGPPLSPPSWPCNQPPATSRMPTLTPNTTPTAAGLPFVTYSRSTGQFSSELRLVSLQLHRRRRSSQTRSRGQNASVYVLNKSQAPFNRGLTALSVESSVLPALAAR